LHHRREGLLGYPARLQEAREVTFLTQLWDAQLDGVGACLPGWIATAVALRRDVRGLLAVGCPGQPLDCQLHQALGRKSNHLAQKVAVRAEARSVAAIEVLLGNTFEPRHVDAGA
jgi:hypothetical protein